MGKKEVVSGARFISDYAKKKGLRKSDAKHHLVVSVDQSCVDSAKPMDSTDCAFARAVMKNNPQIKSAFFLKTTAWLETNFGLVKYSLPQSVQKEIVAFDRFRTMEPRVYKLSVPAESLANIKKRDHNKASTKRHDKGKAPSRKKAPSLRHVTTNVRQLKDQFKAV